MDITVSVGKTAEFKCATDSSSVPVDWYFSPLSKDSQSNLIPLYTGNVVSDIFKDYIEIIQLHNGQYTSYNINIKHAQLSYAGDYTCADDSGLGQRSVARLSVLGKFFYCER